MGLLKCPLCGKFTSWPQYDPSGFEMDVKVRELKGLGRGKGFRILGEWSLLEDAKEPLLPMKDRLLDLVALFHEHSIVTTNEICERFGLEEQKEERGEEQQEEQGGEECHTVDDTENDERYDVLVNKIADAIEVNPDAIVGDTPFERVRKGVSLLINEYLTATAEDV